MQATEKKSINKIWLAAISVVAVAALVLGIVGLVNHNDTEANAIPTINQQVDNIKNTLPELEAVSTELKGYIDNLETTAEKLQTDLTATNAALDVLKTDLEGQITASEQRVLDELNTVKTALEAQLTTINNTIKTLQAKDTELDGKITDLKAYVDSEITKTETWANATFATLKQYEATQTAISEINALIKNTQESITNLETKLNEKIEDDIAAAVAGVNADIAAKVKEITSAYTNAIAAAKDDITAAYTDAIKTAITASEISMKEWVNTTLADGYYTIAEIDTKLSDLETKLNGADDTLEAAIEEQKTALATAKTDLTTAYTAAINEAIETNNGTINEKIATDIATAKAELQTQIDGIKTEITAIKADITALNSAVSALQAKIAELENRINCLEGKHVVNETATISYTYTWSETEPTSTKSYTCIHCEKAVVEAVSPSNWQVGDKVTYVAKDGTVWACAISEETTENKLVLRSETYFVVNVPVGDANFAQKFVNEYVTAKGAKLPALTSHVFTDSFIHSTLMAALTPSTNDKNAENFTIANNEFPFYYRNVNNNEELYTLDSNLGNKDVYYFLMWEFPITTAE